MVFLQGVPPSFTAICDLCRALFSPRDFTDSRYHHYRSLQCPLAFRYGQNSKARSTKEIRRIDNSQHLYSSPLVVPCSIRSSTSLPIPLASIEFPPSLRFRIVSERLSIPSSLSHLQTREQSHFCTLALVRESRFLWLTRLIRRRDITTLMAQK